MVTPAAGAVVLVPFPFSDLSHAKLHPAIALADAGRGDCILCQVTSNPYADARAIQISDSDFRVGALHLTSDARPGKLFTANQSLLWGLVGSLKKEAFARVIEAVENLLEASIAV